MKKFILALLLFLTPFTLSAQGGPDAQGGAFTGGTLSSSLTMSDSTAVELATGALTNLSLRLRSDLNTGWYSPSADNLTLALGGTDIVQYQSSRVNIVTHAHAHSFNAQSDGNGWLFPTGISSGYIGWVYGGATKGGFSQWRSSTATKVFYGPDFAKTTCSLGLCLFGPTGQLYNVNMANQTNSEWAEWSFASDTRDVSILAVASGTGSTRDILLGFKKDGVDNTIVKIATNGAYLASTTANASDNAILCRKEIGNLIADAVAARSLDYYYSETADTGDASYEQLLTEPIVALASETGAALTVNDAWVLQDKFLSPVNSPNISTLTAGIYRSTRYKTKSGTTSDAAICGELWKFSVASVSTFIATSTTYLMTLDGVEERVDVDFSVNSFVSFAKTDRIEIRSYAAKKSTGGGGNPTVTNWYGNGKQGYFALPIPTANVMRTDMSNAASSVYSRYTTVTTIATTTFYPGFSFGSNDVLVFLGGVLQEPTADYTESYPVITTTATVASGTRVTILKR